MPTPTEVVYICLRFAMKLLDKKRIKMKKGEHLAINEKNMLAKVCVHHPEHQ